MKRTRKPIAAILENMGLVQKIAWSFHLSTGLELDELIAEGYLTYLEMIKQWEPERGKHTTFMWYCLHSRFQNYLAKELKHRAISIDEIDLAREKKPYFEELTADGIFICDMILKHSQGFISFSKEEIRKRLEFALLNKNWNPNRIQRSFSELETVFR